MAVVPVQAVGHVRRNRVVIRVAHACRDGQQHVVGVPRRAHVQPVGVQVQRRRLECGWVDRNLPAGRGLRGVVEVGDRQTLKVVVVVDDQALAGVDAQRRGGIVVVALGRTVRTRALDELVSEDQEVGHRLLDGVEVDGALMRRQPDLEHAVLTGEPDRLLVRCRLAVRPRVRADLRFGRLLLVAAGRHHRGHRDDDRERYNKDRVGANSPHGGTLHNSIYDRGKFADLIFRSTFLVPRAPSRCRSATRKHR